MSQPASSLSELLPVLNRIADSLERLAPPKLDAALLDREDIDAFLWQGAVGTLLPVPHVQSVPLSSLCGIERQSAIVLENTQHFAAGLPANNVMLWGARGMGKSSLVKACALEVNKVRREKGQSPLAIIEIPRDELATLPQLLALLRQSKRRIILFCDDLSFESQDSDYKSLKSVLDGGIAGRPDNVVVYATSNRKHLMPRDMIENETSSAISPGEAIEEKVSLSDRFGIWIGLYSASQDDYLTIVRTYARAKSLPIDDETLVRKALQWSLTRGSRSGRVASQFIANLTAELESGGD